MQGRQAGGKAETVVLFPNTAGRKVSQNAMGAAMPVVWCFALPGRHGVKSHAQKHVCMSMSLPPKKREKELIFPF